jgi:taurine dioxygenase
MALTLRELEYGGAAEVTGLDCARPLSADDLAAVNEAFWDYPILAIRDQRLSPQQQVAFTRQFGELEDTTNARYAHPDEPLVLVLSNELGPDGLPVGVPDAGDFLHSDLSTRPNPSKATILHAIKTPSRGGDTEFVNLYRVYESLPAELKRRVDGKYAFHHTSKLKNPRVAISGDRPDAAEYYASLEATQPDVRQPVVRTHPETGRQALYVSPRFTLRIDGMEPDASEALLRELFAQMKPLVWRYKWQPHDLVMWDNRCLNHRATGGYVLPDTRRMHRTSLMGDPAFYDPAGGTPNGARTQAVRRDRRPTGS